MTELQNILYQYVAEKRMEKYLDQWECGRLERQTALEEEKLESLLPADYKQLFREYGEHLYARSNLNMEALFRATLVFAREYPPV